MKLNLMDELTLLALDDEKGSFLTDSISFAYGIAGAVILELTLRDKIEVVKDNVIVKNNKSIGDELLDTYLDLIYQSKKEKTLEDWIQHIGEEEDRIKNKTIDKLVTGGILIKKEEKFLWLFSNDKYPAVNSLPETRLRNRLCKIIENNLEPKLNEAMLISLIDSCSLNEEVFGKDKAKLYKKKIKAIIENTQNTKEINKTVKKVHEMIMTIIVILIASTLTTTTIINN